jgi:hypothetical protein
MNPSLKRILIAAILFVTVYANSQSYDQLKTQLQFEDYYGTRLRSTKPGSLLSGSECLLDEWLPVEITLPTGIVTFDRGRLNLVSATAEVIYKNREMFISSENFKSIKMLNPDRFFLPGPKYSKEGLLEVFEPQPAVPFVMVQHYVYVKEPNSNGYINGGSLNKELVQARKFFLYDGEKLIPIKGKSSLQKFYSDKKDQFAKLRKELEVDFKNPRSIHFLVTAMGAVPQE